MATGRGPGEPSAMPEDGQRVRDVSVIVPVYQGATTLDRLVSELSELREVGATASGVRFRVAEVILVWDRGPDASDEVIRRLAIESDLVVAVWLSRNFGQHAATAAGIAASSGEWVVTLDEDGLHDPRLIGAMLDEAFRLRSQLVYGRGQENPSHAPWRNASSRATKWLYQRVLSDGSTGHFSSYRLVLGHVARSVVATAGHAVYLDVALSWAVHRVGHVDIQLRPEGRAISGYDGGRLRSHFGRLLLSSGARPLRAAAALGALLASTGFTLAGWVVFQRLRGAVPVQGWASSVAITLVASGAILLVLSVIARYVSSMASILQGRPLYFTVEDEDWVFG